VTAGRADRSAPVTAGRADRSAPVTAGRADRSAPAADRLDRIGLVAHPRRGVAGALETVRGWAARRDADVVQLRAPGNTREVAPVGEPEACDLVIALGGDGTTLAALAAAAPVGRPVLGVACGSLGALTAAGAEHLDAALERVARGEWIRRRLPAVAVQRNGGGTIRALNDVVLTRAGAGQVSVELTLDGERVIRFGGDGIVAATPLGSTAYTLAAGGPMLAPGTAGLVLTPLAPHGGVCPPVVTAVETRVEVALDPGFGGARIEADGRVVDTAERLGRTDFAFRYEPEYATLVALDDDESLFAGLRRRRILIDSPRVLARDDREGAEVRDDREDAEARDGSEDRP
jgi:NAD+ kinase